MFRIIMLKAMNRVLMGVLVLAILGTGALAVSLTHVHASVTVTFGDKPEAKGKRVASADDAIGIYMAEAAPAYALDEMPIEAQKTIRRAAGDNGLAQAKRIMSGHAK